MNVFEFFSCVTKLPVRIDTIVDFLKDSGFVHEVYFSEVDINPDVLWAMVRAYYPRTVYDRDMPPIYEVIYSKHLTPEQQRLACCKELLHALDSELERATSQEAVDTLIQQMAIPPNAGISLPSANDHLGVVRALVVLVPEAALHDVKTAFDGGKMSEGEIAQMFEIPVEYVRLTLTDFWKDLADRVLQLHARAT